MSKALRIVFPVSIVSTEEVTERLIALIKLEGDFLDAKVCFMTLYTTFMKKYKLISPVLSLPFHTTVFFNQGPSKVTSVILAFFYDCVRKCGL